MGRRSRPCCPDAAAPGTPERANDRAHARAADGAPGSTGRTRRRTGRPEAAVRRVGLRTSRPRARPVGGRLGADAGAGRANLARTLPSAEPPPPPALRDFGTSAAPPGPSPRWRRCFPPSTHRRWSPAGSWHAPRPARSPSRRSCRTSRRRRRRTRSCARPHPSGHRSRTRPTARAGPRLVPPRR